MKPKSNTNMRWSGRASPGCMWGLISMFRFRLPRHLINQRHRDDRHPGHYWYKKRKVKLLTDTKWKHEELGVRNSLEELDKANEVRAKATESARKKIEKFNVKQPEHSSKAESEVIKLEDSQLSSTINLTENNGYNAFCNICTNELKLATCLENERPYFLELLKRMSNDLDFIALLEQYSGKKKNQEIQEDSRYGDHLCSHGRARCSNHNIHDHTIKEQVRDCLLSKENLYEVLKIFLCDALLDARTKVRGLGYSEESRHCQEILDPNEMLENVLHYANSNLKKYIERHPNGVMQKLSTDGLSRNMQNSELLEREKGRSRQCRDLGSHKQIQPCNMDKLLLKDGSLVTKTPKIENTPQTPTRIVVLKPHLGGTHSACDMRFDVDKRTSNFSFQEMKKRLKHLFRENKTSQRMIANDALMHRVPSGFAASGSAAEYSLQGVKEADMPSYSSHKTLQPVLGESKESKTKPAEYHPANQYQSGSTYNNLYRDVESVTVYRQENKIKMQMETRRQLRELLYGNNNDQRSEKRPSKSLGRLLAFPEYDVQSPTCSPRKDKEASSFLGSINFSLEQEQNTKLELLSVPCLRSEIPSSTDCSSAIGPDEQLADAGPFMNQIQKNDLNLENSRRKGVDREDTETMEEKSTTQHMISEDKNKELVGAVAAYGYKTTVREDSSADVESSIGSSGKPELPSPVSVLEPLFTAKYMVLPRQIPFEEHVYSADTLTTSNLCINDEEFKFEYLRTLLEASGLCSCATVEQLQSPSQLLDLSLYDEVETPSGEIPDDLKLFFDCMNEAVEKIYEKSSTFMPWVSHFSRSSQPFPTGEHLIQEAWKGLNRIFVLKSPRTMEQIVKKDLKTGVWADVRSEAQGIGVELENMIYERLLEETLYELGVYIPVSLKFFS